MFRNLCALISFFMLISCADRQVEREESITTIKRVSEIVEMKSGMELCQSKASSIEDEVSFWLQRFQKGEFVYEGFLYNKIKKQNSGIKSITHGLHVQHNDYIKQLKSGKLYKYKKTRSFLLKEDEELDICNNEDYAYTRYYLENSAFNSIYGIISAKRVFSESVPNIVIPPVSVSVSPIFETKLTLIPSSEPNTRIEKTYYDADNAYYSLYPKNDPIITILPQSKEAREKEKVPLWTLPMVGAHEYGHHIFYVLFPKFFKTRTTQENVTDICFTDRKQFNIISKESDEDKRNNKSFFTIRAINETFADLIAYYGLDENNNSYKKVDCFENSRDVNSLIMGSGDTKMFSETFLKVMNDEYKSYKKYKCDEINPQNIYSVAAVNAFIINAIFDEKRFNRNERIFILSNWLKRLNENYELMKPLSAANYLFSSFEYLVDEVNKTKPSLRDDLGAITNTTFDCSYIKDLFGVETNEDFNCSVLNSNK